MNNDGFAAFSQPRNILLFQKGSHSWFWGEDRKSQIAVCAVLGQKLGCDAKALRLTNFQLGGSPLVIKELVYIYTHKGYPPA